MRVKKGTIKAIPYTAKVYGHFQDLIVTTGDVVNEVSQDGKLATLYGRYGWYTCDCQVAPGDVVVTEAPMWGYAHITAVLP